MWLLHTYTFELRWFHHPPLPSTTGHGYAILSHVWDPQGEQTHQDLKNIVTEAQTQPITTKLQVDIRISAKIRNCCAFARSMGYCYVWIDSCCVDKTSSAELSETINSMFEWYTLAAVCYAFLGDVDGLEDPASEGSVFRRSRWFTRGWTLQELIAPRDVLFLCKDWHMLGTKEDLADVVEDVTGVDRAILLQEKKPHEVSVARRMSWASRRETTRVEDEAYSLLGLFGLCMPAIYGEGRGAFIRLQEEILKHLPDQSIFAWGPGPGSIIEGRRLEDTLVRSSVGPGLYHSLDAHGRMFSGCGDMPTERFLLAQSPRMFRYSSGISPIDTSALSQGLGTQLPGSQYTITSYGVRTQFPIFHVSAWGCDLAVLACEDNQARIICLVLTRAGGPGCHTIGFSIDPSTSYCRAAAFSAETLTFYGSAMTTDVCIMHRPIYTHPHHGNPTETRVGWAASATFWGPCSIIIPSWNISRLRRAGYTPTWTGDGLFSFTTCGQTHSTLTFTARSGTSISVFIGLCPAHRGSERRPLHACVLPYAHAGSSSSTLDCREEHVARWKDLSKTWRLLDGLGYVMLKFKNWPCGDQTPGPGAIQQPLFALEIHVDHV
ncbi:heterokaryon incompatibility protein-domain-containing protein [Trametes maxima]|nr:heterokaryon incompatibility protein-domain-containing protein [Trametes maxima]